MKKNSVHSAAATTLVAMLLFSLGFSSISEAYIPSSRTIFSRTAKNNGKGVYAIEQEVQFRSLAEPLVLRERWIVENGENMRLYVTAPKPSPEAFKFDVVYRDGKKTAPDFSGMLRTSGTSPEFIESFQHYRSGRGLMEALVRAKILPASFIKDRPRVTTMANVNRGHSPEPMVRLGRSSGTISWIFGEPTPATGTRLNPGAWVEQDAFVLQKLRFPSQAEVSANNQSVSSGTLQLPKERTITWDNNTVVIRVISVKPAPSGAATAKLLAPSSVTAADAKAVKLPEQPQVKEFYTRFR